MNNIENILQGKTILVSGGVGSIGNRIVKNLLDLEVNVVRVLDIDESGLFELREELDSERVRSFIGSVRDKNRLKKAIEDVDIVFHAAALKHVPLCEYNPFEAVKTNVLGTQSLIDAAMNEEVQYFVTISTDKVVNPINVMGSTKLLAERLTTSANFYKGKRKTRFFVVRFGNVLNSRGSLLPVIKNQIKKGGPVTLTDPKMTRFMMSKKEAVQISLNSLKYAEGGEIFVLKMPSVKIKELIEVVIEEIAPKYGYSAKEMEIDIIGKRRGERLFEKLMTKEESKYAKEIEDMYVLKPKEEAQCYEKSLYNSEYVSKDAPHLNKKEIKELLIDINYI